MKNEKIARAMTHIDDALILEAAAVGGSQSRGGRILKWQQSFVRWGSLAACLLIAVGIMLGSLTGGGVTLEGQRLGGEPILISSSAGRSTPQTVSYSSDTVPEFTLDFGKSTTLDTEDGTLEQVLSDGTIQALDEKTPIRGAVTLRLQLDKDVTHCTITTDRDYSIVLDNVNGEWYISIEK